jgi:prepilin-type N-terminal cleavage/methylation domain-containing protein
MRKSRAFTLVELLVVIGIIAVLVGILLPALSAAKRQANTVKCATALREIGTAFQMYCIDNKGWYPPAQIQPPLTSTNSLGAVATYDVAGVTYPNSGVGAFWFNFLGKYVTKTKTGVESTDSSQTNEQRLRSLFWGCPAWEGYITGSVAGGGYSRVQTGYGMNGWPTFQANYPAIGTNFPPTAESSFLTGAQGTWPKQKSYLRDGSQRALIGDSRFWLAESNPPPATGPWPSGITQQAWFVNTTYTGTNQTLIDIYRHGKLPAAAGGDKVAASGGKIAFNILYSDSHVATSSNGQEAYKALRMKFPG